MTNETQQDLILKQNVDLSALQQRLSVDFVDDAVRDSLLAHLSVVDLLLHRVVTDQSVYVTAAGLAVAIDAAHGLAVVTRVPRRVKHNHATSTDQVDAEAASAVHTTRN